MESFKADIQRTYKLTWKGEKQTRSTGMHKVTSAGGNNEKQSD